MSNNFKITLEDLLKVDPNISIVLKQEKLKEMHALIKSNFGSVKEFSKIIGFCPQALFNWLTGKRNPKLKIAKRIFELLKIKTEDFTKCVICLNEPVGSFIPINAFPIKMDVNLASLVGHSFGDGHISISFEFTNKCEELLNDVISTVKKLPIKNVKVIINRQPNKTPTLVFPKMVRNILIFAGAPLGNKITNNFALPEWIKFSNKEAKIAFIRALFDDEGNVSSNRTIRLSLSKRKDLSNNLYEFFEEIKLLLEELGIKKIKIGKQKGGNGKNGETIENTLTIFGFHNFQIFYETIKFDHPKKMEILRKILNDTKIIRNMSGESKENIIKILTNNPLTIDDISQKIGISWKATWEHLKNLESKNLVNRNKIDNSRKSFWSINYEKIDVD